MKPYINSSKIYPTARNFQLQMATRAAEPVAKNDDLPAHSRSMMGGGYKTFSDFHNFSAISGGTGSQQPSHLTSVNFYKESSGGAMDRTAFSLRFPINDPP